MWWEVGRTEDGKTYTEIKCYESESEAKARVEELKQSFPYSGSVYFIKKMGNSRFRYWVKFILYWGAAILILWLIRSLFFWLFGTDILTEPD